MQRLPSPTDQHSDRHGDQRGDGRLAPRTHFTMLADGSSGSTQGGEGIPNIDSVKKTIYAYYGDPTGTGAASTSASPYISRGRRDPGPATP